MKNMLLLISVICIGLCPVASAQNKEQVELPRALMEKINTENEARIAVQDLIPRLQIIGGELRNAAAENDLRKLERRFWEYEEANTRLRQVVDAFFAAGEATYATYQAVNKLPELTSIQPRLSLEDLELRSKKRREEIERYVALGEMHSNLRKPSRDFLQTMNATLWKIFDENSEARFQAQDILDEAIQRRLGALTSIEQESRATLIQLCKNFEKKSDQQCYRQYVPDWPPK